MNKKILIVDDEAHIRMLIEQTLEELEDEGVEFLTAENGEAALSIIQEEKPQLVFLDEPSSALDPVGRAEVRSILERLKAKGVTIFLNSHLLGDVEALCDRMALLNDGVILRHGTASELLSKRSTWLNKRKRMPIYGGHCYEKALVDRFIDTCYGVAYYRMYWGR